MSYYEIVYIVHPALQAGHLDDTVNQINKKIEQLKGEVLFFENWGKKKLSYMIQKQKYGTYILFQCKIDGQKINELTSEFEHNANILRHLISKVTEDEIFKPKEIEPDQSVKEKVEEAEVPAEVPADSKEEASEVEVEPKSDNENTEEETVEASKE
tara:strand:+ start:144 stop:611 length:468 start_codon:yes stop_codon:yes gene_type:complete